MENTKDIFSKYYKRLENDLKQIHGMTPLVLSIISMNYRNLEEAIVKELVDKENCNEEQNN